MGDTKQQGVIERRDKEIKYRIRMLSRYQGKVSADAMDGLAMAIIQTSKDIKTNQNKIKSTLSNSAQEEKTKKLRNKESNLKKRYEKLHSNLIKDIDEMPPILARNAVRETGIAMQEISNQQEDIHYQLIALGGL